MTKLFEGKTLRDRVLALLKSDEEYGGPQSINDLCKNLGISNGSSRSILVKLHQAGRIDRIDHGIYRIKGDSRKYGKNRSYYSET